MIKPPNTILAIDPSSGAKSLVGVCIIRVEDREIIDILEISCPKYTEVEVRIKIIHDSLKSFIHERKDLLEGRLLVAIEYTVMMGKGGESLNRAIGAIIAATPVDRDNVVFRNVQNTTIKRLITGSGKAEKLEVATGLLDFFNSNINSCNVIKDLTVLEKWDILDSIAIGVTAYLQEVLKDPEPGKTKPKKVRKGVEHE